MTEKIYRAWHVCPVDMMTVYRPDRPRMPIVEGETLTMHENDRLRPCVGADGLHGAVLLLDALGQRIDGRICAARQTLSLELGNRLLRASGVSNG